MTRGGGDEADFIIVGAGSAGCVLANRLSADGQTKVILIEAGGDDRPFRNLSQFLPNLMIRIPAGFATLIGDPRVDWKFKTLPNPSTGQRIYTLPGGKVLGGSSAINGLIYVRGQPEDYDGWRQMGCEGWSWSDVLPYFRRSENQERGADPWHGEGGPLSVSNLRERTDVEAAVIDACEQAGMPRRSDYNGPEQEGASWYQQTARGGVRCSTAIGFLHHALKRSNLRVFTNAVATKVLVEGNRAVGVTYTRAGATHEIRARREVIVSSGALKSPQLLQLSGVGSPSLLKERGIEVAASVPGVGENLHDHFGVMMAYRLLPHVQSINQRSHGVRFLGELLRYALQRRGLLTLTAGSVAAFGKSRPDVATADIQYHIMAASYKIHRSNKTQPSVNPKSKRKPRSFYRRPLEREPGLTFAAYLMRPASRGSVRISSSDPMVAPAITPNYLAERSDQLATVQALRGIKTIISQSALKPYISHPTVPDASYETDDDLLRHARSTGAPAYHPVGTCRMGSDDASVVDPKLRVRGVAGLRVVDASIMPRIASGNTNAPTIMIAEKAADMILGR